MGVLEQVVIRVCLLLLINFCLISCERFHGIEDSQILDWTEKNAQVLTELAGESVRSKVEGEIQSLSDIDQIKGYFQSFEDESALKELAKGLLNETYYPDKKITFNLQPNNKHQTIYITLYLEGFCAAFSDCLNTYLVYHVNKDNQIREPSYHYSNTKLLNWYILKVTKI